MKKSKTKRTLRKLVVTIYAAIACVLFMGSMILLAGVEDTVKLYNTEFPVLLVIVLVISFCIGGAMIIDFQKYFEIHN